MNWTAASGLLTIISPLLACAALLVIVLRSSGGFIERSRATPEISKARLLVNISAASGALAFALLLGLFVADLAGAEVLAPVGIFAGILSIPSMLWLTKWRQLATDITGIVTLAMIIPFVSFWTIVVSLAGLLLVAGSLLRSVDAQAKH